LHLQLSEIEECVIEALHYERSNDEQLILEGICKFSKNDYEGFDAFVKTLVECVIDSDDYGKSIGGQKRNFGKGQSPKVVLVQDSRDDLEFRLVRSASDIELCDSDCDTCVSINSPRCSSPDTVSPVLVGQNVNSDVTVNASLPQLQSSSQLAFTSPDANNNSQIMPSYTLPRVESCAIESNWDSTVDSSNLDFLSAALSHHFESDEQTVSGLVLDNSVTFTDSAIIGTAVVTASTSVASCKPMASIKKLEESGAAAVELPSQSSSKLSAKIMTKSNDPSTLKAQKPSSTINQVVRQHPYKKPYEPLRRTDLASSSRKNTCVENIFKIYREHRDLDDLLRCQTTKLFCKRLVKPFIDTDLLQMNYLCDEPAFKQYNFVRTTEMEARRILGRLEEIHDDIEDIPFTAEDIQHFAEKSKLAEELDRAMAELPESSNMAWF